MSTLIACDQKLDYATEGPFVVATHTPAGPEHILNMYTTFYIIDLAGNLTVSTEETNDITLGDDAPVLEMKVDEQKVEQLQSIIEKNNFWEMPENVEDRSILDGESQYVTVHLEDESKKVGGLNPSHEDFLDISDYMFRLVDSDKYATWKEEIEAHIYEMNPDS